MTVMVDDYSGRFHVFLCPGSMQVNNNGLISFGTAISTYTPEAFPLAGGRRFIAPYWADVDTRPLDGGTVWYREERDSDMLVIAKEDVEWAFPGTGFQPKWLFIATWENVGYYNQKTNKVSEYQSCYIAIGSVIHYN